VITAAQSTPSVSLRGLLRLVEVPGVMPVGAMVELEALVVKPHRVQRVVIPIQKEETP